MEGGRSIFDTDDLLDDFGDEDDADLNNMLEEIEEESGSSSQPQSSQELSQGQNRGVYFARPDHNL